MVEIVDDADPADRALERRIHIRPYGSAVGALGLYVPEVAQGLHLPVLEEHG